MNIRPLVFLSFLVIFFGAAREEKINLEQPKPSSTNPLLPGANELIDFAKLTPQAMRDADAQVSGEVEKIIAAIVAVDDEKRRFDNTMLPLDEAINKIQKMVYANELLSNTNTNKEILDLATELQQKYTTISEELFLNENLFKALNAYARQPEALSLSGERKFFVTKCLDDFNHNGMALAPAQRDSLRALNKQLNELSVQFNNNISHDKSMVLLEEQDMQGMDESFKATFRNRDGKYYVNLSTPVYFQYMSYAKRPEARKKMYTAKMNIGGGENERLLLPILQLRKQKANLLGYKTFSELATSDIMAKNPKNVWDFEKKLATDLRPKAQKDLALLLAAKSKETGKRETIIYPYDASYYTAQVMKEKYQVDMEQVKNYFEIQHVITGVFSVYQQLYNLSFTADTMPSVWHKDVQAFSVIDNATGKRIGYFYLDLYPRENKFNHFACFPLAGSKRMSDGQQQLCTAALVCNFPAPTADKPSLLTHAQTSTFFHEFGHLIHVMLSETELATFAGTNVATDFVEAPSQIMENWCWQKNVLRLFAKHYKTGETIPDSLVDRMIAARTMNSGVNMLQQVFFGTLDFTLNDGYEPKTQQDITSKVRELQNNITFYPWVEDTHFAGSFGHLTGYGSRYYGYLWSLVYAQDMFSVFEKQGVLSPEVGKRYRKEVLSKGGSVEALQLVRNFVGREPNNKAFLKQQGLN